MAQTVSDNELHRVVGVCFVYRFIGSGDIEYLVLKRSPNLKVYPGLWTIPGGGLERDDYEKLPRTYTDGWEAPLEIATRREISQEANVEVGPLKYLSHFSFIRPDDIAVFGIRFAAEWISGEAQVDPEDSTECRWILASEVGQYEFLGRIADEIVELDKRLSRSS